MLPLFFQLVLGFDAATSGLMVMPFLTSSVIGAFAGGQFARRLGRTKGIVLAGLGCCVLGLAGLMLQATAGVLWVVLPMSALLGLGIGGDDAERADAGAERGGAARCRRGDRVAAVLALDGRGLR